jgi:hypothetical protein
MNFIIANLRARRIILIMCLPKFSQLDKDIREVALSGVFQMISIDRKKQRSKAKFKWRDADEMTDFMKDLYPRIKSPEGKQYMVKTVSFPKPPKELDDAYKTKKLEYMDDKVRKWFLELTDSKGKTKKVHTRDIAEEVLKNPEKYQTNGKFDYVKIIANFDVGDQKARNITKTVMTMA